MKEDVLKELTKAARTSSLFPAILKSAGIELEPRGRSRLGSQMFRTTITQGITGDYSSMVFYQNIDRTWTILDNSERCGRKQMDSIGFLTDILGYRFLDALQELTGNGALKEAVVKAPKQEERKEAAEKTTAEAFKKLPGDKDRKNAIAYLVKSRAIPYEVVADLIKRDLITQSPVNPYGLRRPVVVFNVKTPEGELVGQRWRTTRTENYLDETSKRFIRGCVPGSDGKYAWHMLHKIDVITPDTKLFFCEAEIDAISLRCLIDEPGVYLSMGGLNDSSFEYMTKLLGGTPVICTDNDVAGNRFRERFPQYETLIPRLDQRTEREIRTQGDHPKADWNINLQYRAATQRPAELKR